jgi:energy-coupling factor transporter ATP-binding protein EcfA2
MNDKVPSGATNDERANDEARLSTETDVLSHPSQTSADSRLHQYPLQCLEALASSIHAAHETNPNSWALKEDGEGLILFVKNTAVMISAHAGASFIASDPLDHHDAGELKEHQIYRGYSFPAFYLRSITPDQFHRWFPKYRDQHLDAVRMLAGQVKTRVTFNHWHHQHVVEELGAVLGETLPAPGYFSADLPPAAGQWRYSIYRDHWATERKDGYISSQGWPNPTINLHDLPSEEKVFSAELQALPDLGPEAARRLWNLAYGMKAGDKVIAHEGSQIKAIGVVVGEYSYHPESPTVMHRRSVTWSEEPLPLSHFPNSPAATRAKKMWGTIPLTDEDFIALTNESPKNDGIAAMAGTELLHIAPFSVIRQAFGAKGLIYTDAQIATFYTALQTKGFVVLSGISGTGKSKIAQHFVEMLPQPSPESQSPVLDPERVIRLSMKPYTQNHRHIVIPVSQLHALPAMRPGEQWPIPLRYNGASGTGRLVNEQRQTGSVTKLFFHSGILQHIKELSAGTPLFLVPVEDIDNGNINAIEIYTDPRQLPDHTRDVSSTERNSTNSLFLAVRPDWRDSTSLLGYYNPLTQTYEWTEFLRFLLRAKESFHQKDGLAWFVILDEMNLAHVEYYFADLLSIIESGRDDEGWSREAIRLTYPDTLTDNAPPHEIKLPPNLYIIGTVNMDETTHAFSPKVLDRAFTIELTEVSFADYPPITNSTKIEIPDEERQTLLRAFTRNKRFAIVDKQDIRAAVDNHPDIRTWLDTLNTRLATHQFHFGYRVFDEIAQFIFNADENKMFVADSADEEAAWIRAFDHAVYMKVLPKFNGSHARLHGPLTVRARRGARRRSTWRMIRLGRTRCCRTRCSVVSRSAQCGCWRSWKPTGSYRSGSGRG